jgi:peptidoglycan/xylan/chitin deacetylase (PgdA/CDA1 family)
MHPLARSISLNLSRRCGVQRIFRRRSRGPVVLFYHGVVETIVDPEVQGLHLPFRIFEKQIRFLRREREVISLDDLSQSLSTGMALDPRQVLLTFDDGYKNNLEVVAPLLKAWRMPFAIFISTKQISEAKRFPMYLIRTALLYTRRKQFHLKSAAKGFDLSSREKRLAAIKLVIEIAKKMQLDKLGLLLSECQQMLTPEQWAELNARFASDAPMTWSDVAQTRSLGATIGSHTQDHCILHANQTQQEIHQQLTNSKRAIADAMGDCKYLAFPNGTEEDVSTEARAAAESAQFAMAFSTIRGEITRDTDRLFQPRIFALPNFEEFCYLLNRSGDSNEVYQARSPFSAGTITPAAIN